jgi:RNA polymerase sigma-70 factor, ECF subfamily
VLILRAVLRWQASETADLLGTTTTAVNSMLQRARTQLSQAAPVADDIREPADLRQRRLLDRYAAAFENADGTALARLLRQDAVLEMPPSPTWFTGRDQIGRFLTSRVLGQPGDFTMVAVAANGQPGFAAYLRDRDGRSHAHAVQVLTLDGASIAHIVSFNSPELFRLFGLPLALP